MELVKYVSEASKDLAIESFGFTLEEVFLFALLVLVNIQRFKNTKLTFLQALQHLTLKQTSAL